MKKILLPFFYLIVISSIQAQTVDKGWDNCKMYGSDAVRLKIKLTIFDKWTNETYYNDYDNIFENAEECSKYFDKEYKSYPYNNSDRQVDIEITYKCSPCYLHIASEANTTNNNQKKPSPPNTKKLTPQQSSALNSLNETVEDKKNQLVQQHNAQNEKDANKFAGNRPSSSSNFENKQDDLMSGLNEELNSDENIKTTNTDEDNSFDASTVSDIADIAQSFLGEEDKGLNSISNAATGIDFLEKIKRFFSDPVNNADDGYNAFASLAASFLGEFSGFTYDRLAAPIPQLYNNTMNSGLNNLIALSEGRDVDENAALLPIANYFGNAIGLGNLGDKAADFNKDGNKSWNELTTQYGWWEGTKQAMFNHLLNDLKEKYPKD